MLEQIPSIDVEVNEDYRRQVLEDYKTCVVSREASYLARKEVLTGKAKFGILGDGKEVPQVAFSRYFKKGDHRSGYYRDQTIMFALGISTIEQFFAQIYADPIHDTFSGGRQMNSHFATKYIDENGQWTDHTDIYNMSSDISPTAGQMARAVGLALASKKYREIKELSTLTNFSKNGNEVCFCTIGDASTSEGVFWESVNAAGVMQIPLAISVWDDGYGISVPTEMQTTKGSISEVLAGFQAEEGTNGIDIYTAYAWDYPSLCEMYEKGIEKIRRTHRPALFHIKEVTQPQGHSTSGSHERYKSAERLRWEEENDCIRVMRHWMIENEIATEEELSTIEKEAKKYVSECKKQAWKAFNAPIREDIKEVKNILEDLVQHSEHSAAVTELWRTFKQEINPTRRDVVVFAKRILRILKAENTPPQLQLEMWLQAQYKKADEFFHNGLYSSSPKAAINIPAVPATYSPNSPTLNGYQILNRFFDTKFNEIPELLAFGEDVGQIGGVNQGFSGLQRKYGVERIFDTGIREWTIIGQGLGMAMRGLRPIAEIQYLDYLIYGLTPMSDDLATLRYRSLNQQQAPLIIRTRGHRLEGIWHTGSPLGMILNSIRGIYVAVPRNMTQAAGIYNTLLKSDDPGLVIEVLNGYRLKEKLPDNLSEFTVPLGVPEILKEGNDVTLVTYGACVRVAQQAAQELEGEGISVELIDVQTLLPFDRHHIIAESLAKTNRLVIVDEDVPGGASAYILHEILEKQKGYFSLDAEPKTITAYAHRPPYGSDGDYFSKPNTDDIFETIYSLMYEANPSKFKKMYFLK